MADRENSKVKNGISYDILEITKMGSLDRVQMSLEMTGPDWCKFQRSEVYKCLLKYLEKGAINRRRSL